MFVGGTPSQALPRQLSQRESQGLRLVAKALGSNEKVSGSALASPFEEILPPFRGKMSRSDKKGTQAGRRRNVFIMKKENIKKVVLAYSGGLDTSIIIPWLKENYNNCEVIAVSGDVGQGTELDGLEEKAKDRRFQAVCARPEEGLCGGLHLPHPEVRRQVRRSTCWAPALHVPCIAKAWLRSPSRRVQMPSATAAPARATIRCVSSWPSRHLCPDMAIIAPWREWDIKSRDEEIDYAEAHNVPLKINRETNYSKDKNLWHLSHEGLDLEDPANEPQYNKPGFLELGVCPEQAPDEPTYVTIHFEKGIPTAWTARRWALWS